MHGTKQECALAIVAELIRVKNFACLGECCVYVHAGLVVVVSRGCVRAIARRWVCTSADVSFCIYIYIL